MMNTEPARLVGIIMAVVGAILQLLNITVTPENMEALQVIIAALASILVAFGGTETIRKYVASKRTVRGEVGYARTNQLFR
jgi:hypothetical protein